MEYERDLENVENMDENLIDQSLKETFYNKKI